MTATSVRRLFVLLMGFEILPKTVSTRGEGGRFILSEPISAYLLDTESGWILMDAGVDPAWLRDPVLVRQYFGDHGHYPPVVLPEHELEPQLAQLGLSPADIGHVVLSHLHYDHTGYLKHFRHARISIQRREHEFGVSAARPASYFPADYDLPGLDWDLRDGDWEVVPGLTMIDTRGHTEGHQSAIVDLPGTGVCVLPFDAGDLQENFDREVIPGTSCDDAASLAAIRRLKAIVQERAGRLILFHDPVAIQSMRLAPACYD
jgi:N-acyl homoserine lactone hydrolase